MEHGAEGQENNRGLLKGALEEVMGLKNFTISEPGYQPDHYFGKGDLRLV